MRAFNSLLERWLLLLVVAFGVLGLAWVSPPRNAVSHHGVNAALVVLVAAVGVGLPTSAASQARAEWRRVLLAIAVGSTVLPPLAWIASRAVPDGPLRLGVLAAGVAPTEVAAVALAALAGGRAAVSAAVLVGSTVVTVLATGPILHLLAGSGHNFSGTSLLVSLARIVALPLVVGALVRSRLPERWNTAADDSGAVVASVAVLVLIWLVAGEAHLDVAYLRAALALLLFLLGSVLVGVAVSYGLPRSRAISVGLPVAMRDFAIASGIANAAFGAQAAAALGIYGVLVLLLGAIAARPGPAQVDAPTA